MGQAYAVSRDTGEVHGFVRVLAYDVRGQTYDPVIIHRATGYGDGKQKRIEFEPVEYVTQGRMATFPGTQIDPVPLKRGERVLEGVGRSVRDTRSVYALWRCSCGATGHMVLGSWRTAPGDACSKCLNDVSGKHAAAAHRRRPMGKSAPREIVPFHRGR